MSEFKVFKEPLVEFRYNQGLESPHDGLSLFGPYDGDSGHSPKNITYGVICTEEIQNDFFNFSEKITEPIIPDSGTNERLWSAFPGFDVAFNSKWSTKPAWKYNLDRKDLLHASRDRDKNNRAFSVVEKYLEAIRIAAKKRDDEFGVIICLVPDEVWKNCRPKSRVSDSWGHTVSNRMKNDFITGQTGLTWNGQVDTNRSFKYSLSVDFRRQLKARLMEYDIPVQIIRESTLEPSRYSDEYRRGLTPLSDRAWNLSTAIYYKSGGKPWRLKTAREGVCYIGITYRQSSLSEKGPSACCAAQMFLDTGDGIVFLGDEGPTYSPRDEQYHLSREAAKKLLEGVLETYKQLGGKELKEIFLHSRTNLNDEEFSGFREACPEPVKVVGIKVRLEDTGFRIFREGKMPVLRGTFFKWNARLGYLFASGFIPRLGVYPGFEVPRPLRIDIQHGNSTIEQVGEDIFGLTKLNYNACKIGDAEPVTIGFSDAVGEILVSNPKVEKRSPKFKFYI